MAETSLASLLRLFLSPKKQIKFIEVLYDLRKNKSSKVLEDLGYKKISTDNVNEFIYVNEECRAVICSVLGFEPGYFDLVLEIINPLTFLNPNNKDKLTEIINYFCRREEEGDKFIKNTIKKYSSYDVTFLGNSLGGYLIHKNLQGTCFKGYTYNSLPHCFTNKTTRNPNIINYRTSGDLVSLSYSFDKLTRNIDVNFIDYIIKSNFKDVDIFKYFLESHYLEFLSNYADKQIKIDIPASAF
jgi:hypothetical protein